uniref:Uncharacterized protein n=1 Tax=Meloidogyne incognita TaxID=6306 RepID=A0A914LN64_MELIC
MVTLIVPNEFEIVLTRLGDDLQTKWCLLNIKILVTNAEVGQGQRLVHPLQMALFEHSYLINGYNGEYTFYVFC